MIPSFRIWGYFPPFRDSVIPRFHLLGFGMIFRRSVISPFRHSAVPSFQLLGSPIRLSAHVGIQTLFCIFYSLVLVQKKMRKLENISSLEPTNMSICRSFYFYLFIYMYFLYLLSKIPICIYICTYICMYCTHSSQTAKTEEKGFC